MIGKTVTRATRTRSRVDPLVGRSALRTPNIPPEDLLSSMYEATIRLIRGGVY